MYNVTNVSSLTLSQNGVVSGTVTCSSAAPAIATEPRTALFISLANTSMQDADYAIFNDATNTVVDKGTLHAGKSKAVRISAQDNPNIVRIQNTSLCDASGVTPSFTYAASSQGS